MPAGRAQLDELTARLPPAPRRIAWRARRRLGRYRRRRLEARGDWSRSRPAQYGLEQALSRFLPQGDGFFVEAGALDGYFQSNTYWLERGRGWHGLLIEPYPELASEARRERPGSRVFNCALVPADYPEPEITLTYRGAMTVVERELHNAGSEAAWEGMGGRALDEPEHSFTVPARTLSSVLDEAGTPEIDFLSLDVEGFEPDVLRGLDLARHAPRWILVETDNDPPRVDGVRATLGERYAEVEPVTPIDLLLRRID